MKKLLSISLALCLSVGILTGCGGITVVQLVQESEQAEELSGGQAGTEEVVEGQSTSAETEDTGVLNQTSGSDAVKTGLSISTALEGTDAANGENGSATANITLVAVTVDDEGIIRDCTIDQIKAAINFSEEGMLAELPQDFSSKNELGESYGMKAASSIGKEWNEQAEALAQYAIGKTVQELKEGAIDETGTVKDADLAASATMYIAGFVNEIEGAVNQATHLGALSGDEVRIVQLSNAGSSQDATSEQAGLVQIDSTIAALTMNEGTITSCIIDGLQAKINFDHTGVITSDLSAPVVTKNELGDDYGMRAASPIGKEWNEQAAGFAAYITGKTVEEVSGIAITEEGKAADADLAASVTISIGGFIDLIEKIL